MITRIILALTISILSIGSAIADTQTPNNSPQHEVLLGEMNDQSPDASKYQPTPAPVPKFIQEQNAISNKYEQEQIEIEEEEDYYSGMGFGMFDGPFLY